MGDEWGETDTRFLYGAFNALSLLGLLDLVDVPKAVNYIQKCENLDGGYGICPGAESHAGQVLTCVGALAIAGRLDLVNKDRLGGWLSERQLDNGGFNGRPEKLEDVCYSWWVGASLAMIDRLHWIDGDKLAAFILRCQVSSIFGNCLICFRLMRIRIRKREVWRTGLVIWSMSSIQCSALQA